MWAGSLGNCRINIADYWVSKDFADLFSEMEVLNEAAHFAEISIDGQTTQPSWFFRLRRSPYYVEFPWDLHSEEEIEEYAQRLALRAHMEQFYVQKNDLQIRSISFGSPGFVDFFGFGKAVSEIRRFIFGIADRYSAREDRELDRESKRQDIIGKKLKNAERFLKLDRKLGIDADFRRNLLRTILQVDYFFESKILDGKISSVEGSDEDE